MSIKMFILMILGIVVCIITFPVLFIWSLNTLFKTGIAYGIYEWLAVVSLFSLLGSWIKVWTSRW